VKVEAVEVEEKEELMAGKSDGGSANGLQSANGEKTKPKQQKSQKQVGGMTIGVEEMSDLVEGLNDLDLSKTTAPSTTPKNHHASLFEKMEHDEAVPNADTEPSSSDPTSSSNQKNEKHRPDPIYMFGVLVPQALRQAQGSFVKAVVGSVPRLVELDGEMRELEIEIRRTRKMLAKQV